MRLGINPNVDMHDDLQACLVGAAAAKTSTRDGRRRQHARTQRSFTTAMTSSPGHVRGGITFARVI